MGCICSKGISEDLNGEKEKGLVKSLSRLLTISKKEELIVTDVDVKTGNDGDREMPMSKPPEVVPPMLMSSDGGEKKDRTVEVNSRIVNVPDGFKGEHVAAGWPSWLTSVAGEAVKGWLPRKAGSFSKLDKIGQGTYSSVYRARDLETGKIVALKKVRFINMDPESVRFMAREISILRRLDHPNVVKLEGLVTSRMSGSLYLVFEYMEHDLAGLAAKPGHKFTEPQVKCYMRQILNGLDHCHGRGVLHRDIKGSNLLIDDDGVLKLADFGLATIFDPDQKQPLTSRVVTLWYRPPELLLGATEYDFTVDLWSVGCILAELLAGKPIMPGRTEVEQLHKIFKLCGSPSDEYWRKSKLQDSTIFKPQQLYPRRVREIYRDFPSSALALLDSLLAIEPADRGTTASALQSEFFTSNPLACDPSSLPKYPPSKEYDAKLRNEEARRKRDVKGNESQTKALPVAEANLAPQKRRVHVNPKSTSEKYNPQEDSGSGFPIDPHGTSAYAYPHTGTSMHPSFQSSWNNKAGVEVQKITTRSSSTLRVPNGPHFRTQGSYMARAGGTDLFNLSASGAARSRKFDQKHMLNELSSSSHKKDEEIGVKESTMGYRTRSRRIHYSGPLMPTGGNMEEMLKEHERQIQHAVRKARLDKTRKNF